MVAGRHPNGELIVERVLVNSLPDDGTYQLLKSPVFVRGICRADVIKPQDKPKGAFNVVQHSGNLCVRVFSKQGFDNPVMEALAASLSADIEKLGGDLDVQTPRALVYSIHVSCGFDNIEKLLNAALSDREDVAWYYGNVYDPETGEPLNWWQAILSNPA